ncbi:uncharacterized protein LY79DRAFT_663942 [Colletotrichum navitas]|uniref:Uncharacterized protein n=1 Tax=Colletotrichum navitas TaxID=681940 RepID=A0AAD8UX68_9PEZI|nr:uncharacterized protein LY79DRAFT_663942 [Colletotrichum navitas]KAK1566043.1 hypothetical protein LY79DRAFT_663942 [Colletotrichum navitas]
MENFLIALIVSISSNVDSILVTSYQQLRLVHFPYSTMTAEASLNAGQPKPKDLEIAEKHLPAPAVLTKVSRVSRLPVPLPSPCRCQLPMSRAHRAPYLNCICLVCCVNNIIGPQAFLALEAHFYGIGCEVIVGCTFG